MSVGDLNIAMVLRLVDRVTAPAKPVLEKVREIGTLSEKAGRAGVDWSNRQIEANRARQDALKGEALGVAALAGSLLALTEPAIQAEKRLAEVAKVVDFEAADGLSIMAKEIRDLVTSGGLATTAQGVTDIVAAGARMGVVNENLPDAEKRKQLLEFATAASKMSVAFGISADEAGETLARWRQNLGLTQTEAMALGDTVNFLGNTMATTEADILQVINRQGVVAKTAGLAANETAALSAAILAAGASPEIAATGLKNFTNALVKGASLTDRQSSVFKALGLDGVEMAKRMQTDAKGGIMAVLEAFQEIEPYRRSSLIGDLFGEEAKGAITPLIDNVELLGNTFANTADTSALLGLMEKEYQAQAATTHAQRQRLLQYVSGLAVVVGGALLPALNELMASVMPLVSGFTDWAAAHPELIANGAKLAGVFLLLRVASIAARFGFFALAGPVLKLIRFGGYLMIILPKVGGVLLWLARGPTKLLLSAVGLLVKAFARLAIAALANPIGATIAAVAALAYVVYQNWDKIVAWLMGKIDTVKAAFEDGLFKGIFTLFKEFNPITLIAEAIGGLAGYLVEVGGGLMQSIWDGMSSVLGTMVEAIKNKLSGIVPDWLRKAWNYVNGGSGEGSGKPPGRDAGGPVRAGVPYEVGERGREIFIPGVSGSILPGRAVKAAMAASMIAGPAAAMPSKNEITQRIDARPAMQAPAQPQQIIRQGDTIHISITSAPGMDSREIARAVARELDRRGDAKSGDLHDGGDF
ncbi:phage tail tape measure protein [Aliiroseovarius lamellibrachiae]|uniref:phage tail tape measure protein n=1 Tax=Aliiroseovarius lamellibrachiae TaxID=1924933 RepID=UPI001BE0FFBD|nr:phage tail tape measure protein [Aliiroseovarius lamellibrachiae]MBT2131235.1 phage tail tape measure protein [Aliiroseovarius lamellibrachiae]